MSKHFWDSRWQNQETGWDLGQLSPPIQQYIDQLNNKDIKILIPGCGNAYEAEYLFNKGFKNVYIVEIAQGAIDSFTKRYPLFPKEQIYHRNFFDLTESFDLVLEQTFFCAIDPSLRNKYVEKMKEILSPNGKLVGVMFNREFVGGPPYGGTTEEYRSSFEHKFNIVVMEDCHNSIEPRLGTEVFTILQVK